MFSDWDPEQEWDDWVRSKANAINASARHVLGDLDRKLPPPLLAASKKRIKITDLQ